MSRFVEKAIEKLPKMDREQVRNLLDTMIHENRRLESLLDSMTEGLLIADTEDNLVLYNKAVERLLPLAAGEILERPIWLAIDDDEIANFLHSALSNKETIRDKEFALDRAAGSRIVALGIFPLVREGRIEGSLARVEDISERRGKEARLRRAENLASLTTLAAGVAHEIKNPLGSMSIHMQLIQRTLKDKDTIKTESITKYIDVVNEEIDRLNRIVVDFLFAVRPMDLHLEDTDINKLLRDLIDFTRLELDKAKIEIALDLPDTLPSVNIDPRYMKQALLNLVMNALQAMPEGGTLALSTRRVDNEIRLAVMDTGVGIPEDKLDKIFEPYYTTKSSGSGLGLTLVFKIIKEHGGEISVRSKQGEGTSFVIRLPVPQREKRLLEYEGEGDAF